MKLIINRFDNNELTEKTTILDIYSVKVHNSDSTLILNFKSKNNEKCDFVFLKNKEKLENVSIREFINSMDNIDVLKMLKIEIYKYTDGTDISTEINVNFSY